MIINRAVWLCCKVVWKVYPQDIAASSAADGGSKAEAEVGSSLSTDGIEEAILGLVEEEYVAVVEPG